MPTLTAMFKDPPDGMVGEAWRILLAVTDGKQLLPAHVQEYCRKHVARWEGKDSNAPVSDSAHSPRLRCLLAQGVMNEELLLRMCMMD